MDEKRIEEEEGRSSAKEEEGAGQRQLLKQWLDSRTLIDRE